MGVPDTVAPFVIKKLVQASARLNSRRLMARMKYILMLFMK
jgi:hypothetical protein